jgi:hypothetical protein
MDKTKSQTDYFPKNSQRFEEFNIILNIGSPLISQVLRKTSKKEFNRKSFGLFIQHPSFENT